MPRPAAMRPKRIISVMVIAAVAGPAATAGAAQPDLAAEIDAQRAALDVLERLDRRKAAEEEIRDLRAWLHVAKKEYTAGEIERALELVHRAQAQTDLIRQLAESSELKARVQEQQAEFRELMLKIDGVRGALDKALARKKALEEKLQLGTDGPRSDAPGES